MNPRKFRFSPLLLILLVAVCLLPTLIPGAFGATLAINGISEQEKKKILEELRPRLEYVLKRKASVWRADDAAFLLERLMIRRGYPEVEVDPVLSGSDRIDLNITPGPQFFFGTIKTVEGTVIPQKDLRQYFLQPLVESETIRHKEAPYILEYVSKGTKNVENYLKSLGYWNATVSVRSEKVIRESQKHEIILDIEPGELLTLDEPAFEGSSEENTRLLATKIDSYLGKSATTQNINLVKRTVEKFYEDNGYQFATVSMRTKHGLSREKLTFNIVERDQYDVHEFFVTGVERTNPRRISRYFDAERGEHFDEAEIDRIVTKIIRTGAFKSLVVNPVPLENTSEAQVNLHIEATEANARVFRSYAGYGNYEGPIIGGGYSDSNFNGNLRTFFSGAEYSGRGLFGEVGITEPRIFNSPIDGNARLFLTTRSNEGYDVSKTGFESSLTWNPAKPYLTRLYASAEYASSSTDSLSKEELGPSDYFVTRLGIEQTVDFRDDALLPTAGYHGRGLLEAGSAQGGAGSNFLRAELENSYRHSLGDKSQLLARLLVSGMRTDTRNLPIDTRLFSGGVNSQRAYSERELGPQSESGDSLGGEAYWVGSMEYTRSFSSTIKGIAFVDAGQVYSAPNDFTFGGPSVAAGIGLRIHLPIGPIRLEYGHNLNRQEDEPSGTFHFSIGASF